MHERDTEIMGIARRVSVGVLVAELAAIVVGVAVAWWQMPQRQWTREGSRGVWQRIGGIDAGNAGERAYIPRRALRCTPDPANGVAEVCEMTVDGRPLMVRVAYTPPSLLFRACRISYSATDNPCAARSPNLSGPLYAGAFASDPGLSDQARAAIRRRYPFENVDEATVFAIARIVAAVVGVCVLCVVFLSITHEGITRTLSAAFSGGAAFLVCYFVLWVFLFGTTYVD